ncbi:MAG: type II toxin-antitoxin system Phd/YefM family antitoxin [Acidobacteria bacterium]|nr:type II toxin-antitoxin system Phd/YefM family antitoxin [Acidobacteriota bacterium]
MKQSTLAASEFKAKCLRLLDEVAQHGNTLVITKRGRPIAKVIPINDLQRPMWGRWEGIAKIKGDLVNFHDDWGPDD